MKVTLEVPDEYASYLPETADDLAEVLSAGLRSWHGKRRSEIAELDDVMELLASLPAAKEILALRPSPALAKRTSELLEKNQGEGLTAEEQEEWGQIMRAEHLVRIAKGHAMAVSRGG